MYQNRISIDAVMRKGKTDKKGALKLSSYGLEKWFRLEKHSEQDQTREDLKFLNRQYSQFLTQRSKTKIQLKSLMEISFPDLDKIFKDNYFCLMLDVYEKYPSTGKQIVRVKDGMESSNVV